MAVDSQLEPLLATGEIQGNIFGGFNKSFQALIYLTISNVPLTRAWLVELSESITDLAAVVKFRRKLKTAIWQGESVADLVATWTNICFSHPGLLKLTDDAKNVQELPFVLGMPARSGLLGDNVDPLSPGNPQNWIVGGPGKIPDIVIIVGSDERQLRDDRVAEIQDSIPVSPSGEQALTPTAPVQLGEDLPSPLGGHEHFGFRDGISQPGVRGRVSGRADDYLTDRLIPQADPRSRLFSAPGQPLIPPGEFVLGYPIQGQQLGDVLPAPAIEPLWLKDGSFLVFRRLRQDVLAFRSGIAALVTKLQADPSGAFSRLRVDELAALLVGRWPSGAPVIRSPGQDNPSLGSDDQFANDFDYVTMGPSHDPFPAAVADPEGLVCPHFAHIRKVNPRAGQTDLGDAGRTYQRRILRRGIPFGTPLPENSSDPDPLSGDRGLLFLAYQASIARQFEFINQDWVNSTLNPRPSGYDMVIGQNGTLGQGRTRGFRLPYALGQEVAAESTSEWIMPTGGGYFFSPAISAIRRLGENSL